MQDLLALTLVALAVWYVGRTTWQRLREPDKATCGTCSGCSSQAKPLVEINLASVNTLRK